MLRVASPDPIDIQIRDGFDLGWLISVQSQPEQIQQSQVYEQTC